MPITFEQVSYIYQEGTPFEHKSLQNVSFQLKEKDFLAVIGHTGSGKSTLIQHMNALLKATSGRVDVDGTVITAETKDKNLKPLRQKVGIVFQFPEAQLFEETVLKDVMFGPLNFGSSPEQAREKAVNALALVGIDEMLFERSPFELSGGQMRRVAIAGILAMEPDVLVLDEPTAGLDPRSRLKMMTLFKKLYDERQISVVLITHQMNDVLNYANRVLLLETGEVVFDGSPSELFKRLDLSKYHIDLPDVLAFREKLVSKGLMITDNITTTKQLIDEVLEQTGGIYAR